MEPALDSPAPADPVNNNLGLILGLGNEQIRVDHLNFLPAFGGSGTPDLDHLADSGESTHLRTSTSLMVRCTLGCVGAPGSRDGRDVLPQKILQVSLQCHAPSFVESGLVGSGGFRL